MPMGEAAGYAAARCIKDGVSPSSIDGKDVTEYMVSLGYEI